MDSGEIVQEYDQHLGPVNTITFVDENRRFVTTSDDKTIRAWDYDIPVVIKYIAEPHMHSMPAVTLHPSSTPPRLFPHSSPTFLAQKNTLPRSRWTTRSWSTRQTTSGRTARSASRGIRSRDMHARWDSRPTASGSAAATGRATLYSGTGKPAGLKAGSGHIRRSSSRTSGSRMRLCVCLSTYLSTVC